MCNTICGLPRHTLGASISVSLSAFYQNYYAALRLLAPWFVVVAVPYFFWMDRRDGGERDGYWHMGQLALLRWDHPRRGSIPNVTWSATPPGDSV